jgi:hypothetical protein
MIGLASVLQSRDIKPFPSMNLSCNYWIDLPSSGMKANLLGIAVLAVAILNTDSFGEKNAITELPGDFTGSFGKRPWPEKVKKPADGLPILAIHAARTPHDLRQPNQGWPNTVSKSILEGFPQLAGLRK